jgi:hypothetical protein
MAEVPCKALFQDAVVLKLQVYNFMTLAFKVIFISKLQERAYLTITQKKCE